MPPVNIAGEGPTDVAVMRRLLRQANLPCGKVHHGEGRKTSKQSLDRKLQGYRAASDYAPWFVLRDLDNDGCVVEVRHRLVGTSVPSQFIFRIAVRTVDAWLMADREALADHLMIVPSILPTSPMDHPDPKKALLAAAAKSKSVRIRKSVSPAAMKGRKISADFFDTMIDFVDESWRPSIAAQNCESLHRALRALQAIRR